MVGSQHRVLFSLEGHHLRVSSWSCTLIVPAWGPVMFGRNDSCEKSPPCAPEGDSKMGKEKWFWAESSRRGGRGGVGGGDVWLPPEQRARRLPSAVRSCAERGQRGLRISTEAGILKTQRRRGLFQGSAISSEASPWNPPGLGAACVCHVSSPLQRSLQNVVFRSNRYSGVIVEAPLRSAHWAPAPREWRTHLVPCHPLAGDT